METNVFGIRIKRLRKHKGINQVELGQALGITRAAVSYYENGERIPNIDVLRAAAEFFEVSSDYLIGLNNDQNEDDSIKVGDVVRWNDGLDDDPFCVMSIRDGHAYGITASGCFHDGPVGLLTRTGSNIDIQSILDQIGGREE